jgi:hypothetical protein
LPWIPSQSIRGSGVLRRLGLARAHDHEPGTLRCCRPRRRDRARRVVELDRQAVLAARHGEINLREALRVEQRAVERAVGVIDLVALAKGVERVPLARMQLARLAQRVDDRPYMLFDRGELRLLELGVEEPTSNAALWMTARPP